MTTGKRVLIGCGIGCGGLLLVAAVLAVSFGVWITRTGELLEPQRLLGQETIGYAEWTLRLEDPGTEGFVENVLAAVQRLRSRQDTPFPPAVDNWLKQRQDKKTRSDMQKLFPLVVAWTLNAEPDGEDDLQLFTVSLVGLGNRVVFADWIMGWFIGSSSGTVVEDHRGEKIYGLNQHRDDGFAFFIRGNDLFFTSDMQTARRAVDRLTGAREERETTDLDWLFERTAERQPFRAALTNPRGEILELWTTIAGAVENEELWSAVRGVSLEGGLREDGSAALTLEFSCPDAAWAASHEQEFGEALAKGLAWPGAGIEIEIDTTAIDDRLRVDLLAADLVRALEAWADGAVEIRDSGVRIGL